MSAPVSRPGRAVARPSAPSTIVRFNIGRLSLPGMSRADTTRVVEAMRAELSRLAATTPAKQWRNLAVRGRLDGGTLPPEASPTVVGRHLATQIYRRASS